MATITLKGHAVQTLGDLPKVGSIAPEFKLTTKDLKDVGLADYAGKKKVLNIFPSLDTPTCAMSVRKFNQQAGSLANTIVLNISIDLPFAQKRFCAAESIENVEVLSAFRSTFPNDYQVKIKDSPLAGFCSRAVVILDENNKVLYTEQVPEISSEPNYDAALGALR